LGSKKVAWISLEGLRNTLHQAGVTYQRTRTWKTSNDPLYEGKNAWVQAAYRAAEAGTLDGVLVSFDECGPISLRLGPDRAERKPTRPSSPRATYRRLMGVRSFFGAYDVGADKLWGVLRAKKDASVVLAFLKDIRRRYPPELQLYIVMDNLKTHWTPEIRTWAVNNHVGLLATPTYASWPNRIERHFWAFVELVINNSDCPDWATFDRAAQLYIRRRNRDRDNPRIRQLESRRRVA
jgi:hypothetical protein